MNRRELLIGAAALTACSQDARSQGPRAQAPLFPMRRGVNLGNALEAPNEGDWGFQIEDEHLDIIGDGGFDGIRLPVRWDTHTAAAAPYAIDPRFLGRVEEVVTGALRRGLYVQLDAHHDPIGEQPERFAAIWRQIAHHFRNMSDKLLLEPFNEPNGDQFTGARLSSIQAGLRDSINTASPNRLVVLGPGNWQNIDALRDWAPPSTESVAVSVHYYEPHAFTHHNAEWLGADAPRYSGVWGADAHIRLVHQHIEQAAEWGRRRGVAMQLGEFGVNSAVSLDQRVLWTRTVREACEAQQMGWCVWDFAGAFPLWHRENRRWIEPLRQALIS
ncbi:glycoside hydrolase family 5 protein [Terricaulis sp.]|uniref:glycoside hydrolase family 5 protein n=1 Tax=Terricaulis sp. TaxID=2768686 RepID=UPI002AC60A4F|nr:glycoside hydrolase family 5 protein [Terricaulis sp.]MDZ4691664.1 glycoside hydrolase family 5 protein [Terricaulis sp.]